MKKNETAEIKIVLKSDRQSKAGWKAVRKTWPCIRKDPVLAISGCLGLISMLLVPPDKEYLRYPNWKVLICLLVLMLAVEMFQEAQLFAAAAAGILNRVSGLRRLTLVLTGLSFLTAMFLTNDVALITLVPLSLLVFRLLDDPKALIRIVVLQTVAANVGSSLTPFGNPQNLFLFAFYELSLPVFLRAVWPVAIAGGILLIVLILLAPDQSLKASVPAVPVRLGVEMGLAVLLFLSAAACVFGLVSEWFLLGLALVLLLPWKPRLLLRADYSLLLTFMFFFLFIGNLSRLPALQNFFARALAGPQRVLLAGAALSQVISNVPAAILLSGFTEQSGQLLRGVNVGGCGTLIASLASVISYKLYGRGEEGCQPDKKRYLLAFTAYNALFIIVLLLISVLLP
ncbi:MAG TPA: citrate transporter [Clostridiales bacterium]|nr:citrate transporter [Clostridiales bacterium]